MIEEFVRKPLADWDEGDLRSLLGQAREDDRSEFKSEMYGGLDDPVREMLRDIASLANHQGGYLLIGVEEGEDGTAGDIKPVVPATSIPHEQRIRESSRSNITPRINGFEVRSVPIAAGGEVLVIHVPYSYTRPHMITFKGLNQFWKRHGTENNPMTIDEIQFAFLWRADAASRVESFIDERKKRATRFGEPWLFLYATPISLPDELVTVQDEKLRELLASTSHVAIEHVGVRSHLGPARPSLTGIVAPDVDKEYGREVAIHRTGQIEFLSNAMWYLQDKGRVCPFPSTIAGTIYDFCMLVKDVYRHLDVVVPLLVGLTIASPTGLDYVDFNWQAKNTIAKWPEMLLDVPPRYVSDIMIEANGVAMEIANRYWNAFGMERCQFFDDDGKFRDPSKK